MSRSSLISNGAMLLALGVAIIALAQIGSLHREIEGLRASIRNLDRGRIDGSATGNTSAVAPPSAPRTAFIDADLLALQRRVDNLEADLNDAIDSLNRTVDEFNRMNAATQKASRPGWSAAQASGPPDTQSGGDHPTAWAAQQQDGGMEWLRAQFETPVDIAQVRVRETDHPGSIVKVTAILEDGREIVMWQGAEPVGLTAPYEAAFNAGAGITARSVQIELDTSKTPGWEEIDAIELVGRDGSRQWAKSVDASSSYGARNTAATWDISGLLRMRGQ
jgi:hypothetical protein